jgi:maltooligosyltrehalose trehalohydrolase
MSQQTTFGAFPVAGGVHFSVWAPEAKELNLVLFTEDGKESNKIALKKDANGIFKGDVKEASVGTRYKYLVDGKGPFPDPASRFQPDGVHGPSQVIDHSQFKWTDAAYKGISKLDNVSLYELHVGTFTKEGTYKGVQSKLEYLKNELGVTAIELLPLADFPGRWNWGYDGVALYAPARCYGTPGELKELVNSAHAIGLAVIIDLVYNHLGPDGNYLSCYNPRYFTKKHNTPWGAALNYDRTTITGKETDDETPEDKAEAKADAEQAPLVRAFVVDNAVSWIRDYHFDGARLDATHAIMDYSKPHVLQDLVGKAKAAGAGRNIYFFAEDDRNEVELITRESGLDSLWADDFHHQVRVCFAGDNESYFANFTGTTKDMADTIRKGWFYCGQRVPDTEFPRGTDPQVVKKLTHFCCCIQNHDQIGNRALGERLNHQITVGAYKTASAILLLIPETPMLFQGQEWASSSPFQFFTDHNEELGKLVTAGRRKEFGKFKAFNDPATREKIPDPQAKSTFDNSKLKWDEVHSEEHEGVFQLYKALLKLRHSEPALDNADRANFNVQAVDDKSVVLVRKPASSSDPSVVAVFHVKNGKHDVDIASFVSGKTAEVIFTTEDARFTTGSGKGDAPVLTQNKVHFTNSSAIILRVK